MEIDDSGFEGPGARGCACCVCAVVGPSAGPFCLWDRQLRTDTRKQQNNKTRKGIRVARAREQLVVRRQRTDQTQSLDRSTGSACRVQVRFVRFKQWRQLREGGYLVSRWVGFELKQGRGIKVRLGEVELNAGRAVTSRLLQSR